MKHISELLQSSKTVFRIADLRILLRIANPSTLKAFVYRAVEQGVFQKIANGIYALPRYDELELAASLRKPSYISFETVLQKEGVVFQDYSRTVTLASNNSVEREIGGRQYRFIKIKSEALFNPLGIHYSWKYSIATKERAICDRLYVSWEQYFDNLADVDWKLLWDIAEIYDTASVVKNVNNLREHAQKR